MSGEHILICEDDRISLTTLFHILEYDGYRVSTSLNGKMALEKILESADNIPVDLLITDIHMPVMNGFDLIKRIRNSGSNLPIIVISGYGDRETLKELIKLGCDDYIDKPFSSDDLLQKVMDVFEKQKSIHQSREKTTEELLNKTMELEREIEAYKNSFTNLRSQFDKAVITYTDLININKGNCQIPFAYRNKTLHFLGGDFADIRDTKFGCDILIADVAGHDLSASYHTILIKAFFDENCRTGKDGRSFFHLLNHALFDNGRNKRMVTALFFRINLETMKGEVVYAGHPKMIRLTGKDYISIPIASAGSVLGLSPKVYFGKFEFNLNFGDRLFFHTDGVTDAYHIDGPTGKKYLLSEDGLDALIHKYRKLPIEEHVNSIWNDIMEYCRYKPQDDMLILGIEIPERGNHA